MSDWYDKNLQFRLVMAATPYARFGSAYIAKFVFCKTGTSFNAVLSSCRSALGRCASDAPARDLQNSTAGGFTTLETA